jgi:hypothetical protein
MVYSIVEIHAVTKLHNKYEIQDSVIQTATCVDSEQCPASLEAAGCDEAESAAVAGLVFQQAFDDPFKRQLSSRSDLTNLSDFKSSMHNMQICTSASIGSNLSPEIVCSFECTGLSGAPVWVSSAPTKLIGRMREKLLEYHAEGAVLCRACSVH